ncbi:tRNA (adenosine(37)-N6)-dimethylallyltransferase MiaA [Aquimarina sp. TRL1]|uniref:tRNA (adenosine(37)-N6)-dimethylallyltransferase MiaA n=1 Tax=Aquimarina sp. (strain TRL1) TaxID=2736252 RepID=UPI00158E72C4|nr:tRNA (adenosine(37)-N6)-dimethylallyltransferase MiaA [Aquimarina sp. TRL1]QKX07447.1 tRNA (adenosine(37)-N6)-dimethylallyltransferase MiaA [Aquimarina sp. TRL1]
MNKHLIVIVGPTAIGKTNLSIQLARHFDCEILSADSRQFFKEMQIGTAAPTTEELSMAPHHCIQHISIQDAYSVGDYEKEALSILTSLFAKKDIAILIGGSGLYVRAVTDGLDDFPEIDPAIRITLNDIFEKKGITALQEQLQTLDPVQYNKMDIQNPHRLIRALEICIGTGTPYSSFLSTAGKSRPFNIIKIGITADRQIIYDRINTRVDHMMEEGLLKEVTALYEFKALNALNTVGYKELFKYLDKEWSLETAIAEIKKNTRRFAKRQLTWFRKDPKIHWFDYQEDTKKIIQKIDTFLS